MNSLITPVFRKFDAGADLALVTDSWTRQIRRLEPWRSMTRGQFKEHRRHLVNIIKRTGALIACSPDDWNLVYGYLCGELRSTSSDGYCQVLHMLYVRNLWRQQGVATALLETAYPELGEAPLWFTHWTRSARHHQHRWNLKQNPYLTGSPEWKKSDMPGLSTRTRGKRSFMREKGTKSSPTTLG